MGAEEKKDPRDALIDLVVADRANTACIIFMMDEKDVRTALASPLVAFCTDSGAGATDGIFSEEKSHPRGWASTARILGHYVRDEKVLRLEEAVRKMTSFPAEARRAEGPRPASRSASPADSSSSTSRRCRTWRRTRSPASTARAIPYVAVNGVLVVDEGKITGAAPGQVLYGPGKR